MQSGVSTRQSRDKFGAIVQIEPSDGTVRLPNGVVIPPSLTQSELRSDPVFSAAKSQDHGTLPWIHYRFDGGQIDGHELSVSLCFYDQLLIYVSISANFYPPGPCDWSQYSLDREAEAKHFHDGVLEATLGPPSQGGSFFSKRIPSQHQTLERPLRWNFSWGTVGSGHDWNGGGTSITVRYAGRHEQADRAFTMRMSPGLLVRVIANLSPGYWRVIVSPGVGLLDGGSEQDWKEEWLPISARQPNAEFRMSGFVGGVPQVVEVD